MAELNLENRIDGFESSAQNADSMSHDAYMPEDQREQYAYQRDACTATAGALMDLQDNGLGTYTANGITAEISRDSETGRITIAQHDANEASIGRAEIFEPDQADTAIDRFYNNVYDIISGNGEGIDRGIESRISSFGTSAQSAASMAHDRSTPNDLRGIFEYQRETYSVMVDVLHDVRATGHGEFARDGASIEIDLNRETGEWRVTEVAKDGTITGNAFHPENEDDAIDSFSDKVYDIISNNGEKIDTGTEVHSHDDTDNGTDKAENPYIENNTSPDDPEIDIDIDDHKPPASGGAVATEPAAIDDSVKSDNNNSNVASEDKSGNDDSEGEHQITIEDRINSLMDDYSSKEKDALSKYQSASDPGNAKEAQIDAQKYETLIDMIQDLRETGHAEYSTEHNKITVDYDKETHVLSMTGDRYDSIGERYGIRGTVSDEGSTRDVITGTDSIFNKIENSLDAENHETYEQTDNGIESEEKDEPSAEKDFGTLLSESLEDKTDKAEIGDQVDVDRPSDNQFENTATMDNGEVTHLTIKPSSDGNGGYDVAVHPVTADGTVHYDIDIESYYADTYDEAKDIFNDLREEWNTGTDHADEYEHAMEEAGFSKDDIFINDTILDSVDDETDEADIDDQNDIEDDENIDDDDHIPTAEEEAQYEYEQAVKDGIYDDPQHDYADSSELFTPEEIEKLDAEMDAKDYGDYDYDFDDEPDAELEAEMEDFKENIDDHIESLNSRIDDSMSSMKEKYDEDPDKFIEGHGMVDGDILGDYYSFCENVDYLEKTGDLSHEEADEYKNSVNIGDWEKIEHSLVDMQAFGSDEKIQAMKDDAGEKIKSAFDSYFGGGNDVDGGADKESGNKHISFSDILDLGEKILSGITSVVDDAISDFKEKLDGDGDHEEKKDVENNPDSGSDSVDDETGKDEADIGDQDDIEDILTNWDSGDSVD